ncbi:MAG: hypothetical protein E7620_02335 [Ruminococcaceae bacterium]|nr:hypothetical protein [Oscillospiraceae bacterium]
MKNIKRLFAVTIILATLLSLASCRWIGGPEDALKAVEERMESLDSYEADMEGLLVYYVRGCRVETTLTGKTIEAETQSEQPYFYQLTETKTKCKELSVNESTSQMEAYYQGNYFISSREGDGRVQKLYSAATVDQVVSYFDLRGNRADFSLMVSCGEKTYQKNDDGTSTLILKGYDEKTLNKLLGMDEGVAELLNADRLDLELTMVIDRAFRLSHLTMKLLLIHEDPEKPVEKDKIPEMTITITFGKFNEATIVTDGLNVEDYKQVDDALQPVSLVQNIKSYADSAEGHFTIKSVQNVTVAGQITKSVETNDVVFGMRDGSYFYDIEADISGKIMTISYANGKQTTIFNSEKTEADLKEADAKKGILNLMLLTIQDAKYATDVVQKEGNSYRITYSDLPKSMEGYFGEGGIFSGGKQTVTVNYSETGAFEGYSAVLDINGYVQTKNGAYQTNIRIEYEITIL